MSFPQEPYDQDDPSDWCGSGIPTTHERSLRELARETSELLDRQSAHDFALWESEQEDWWIRRCPTG